MPNRAERRRAGNAAGNLVNPLRIPKTQKDVEAALRQGRDEGMSFLMNVFIYAVMDRHGASDEDLHVLARDVDDICLWTRST